MNKDAFSFLFKLWKSTKLKTNFWDFLLALKCLKLHEEKKFATDRNKGNVNWRQNLRTDQLLIANKFCRSIRKQAPFADTVRIVTHNMNSFYWLAGFHGILWNFWSINPGVLIFNYLLHQRPLLQLWFKSFESKLVNMLIKFFQDACLWQL